MAGKTTKSSIHRLRWCAVAAPTALLVTALALHLLHAHQAHIDHQRESVRLFADAAALPLRANPSITPVNLRTWCEQVVGTPGVVAACVWDGRGERLAADEESHPLTASMSVVASTDVVDIADFAPPSSLAANVPRLWRVNVALGKSHDNGRAAQATFLVSPERLAAASGGASWWLIVGLLIAWAGVTHWMMSQTRDSVITPLTEMMAVVQAGTWSGEHERLVGRRDEWGKIARCIDDLRMEVGSVRDHVERIERRTDQEIAQETKRIARDIQQLEIKSSLDPLTKLMNRRVFDEKLPAIFAAQRGCGGDLSVIMMDLDQFKKLNDTIGHAAGDDVLEVAGQLLTQCARKQDVAIRYGGDEFLLFLPGVCADDAHRIAQRLIAMFTQQVKVMFPGSGVTMSAGVSSLLGNRPDQPEELVEWADAALYEAKRAGRRCAKVSTLGPVAA
ncbi:MAG: GGDEF domain-containing protein [Planctomycetota bacterium]